MVVVMNKKDTDTDTAWTLFAMSFAGNKLCVLSILLAGLEYECHQPSKINTKCLKVAGTCLLKQDPWRQANRYLDYFQHMQNNAGSRIQNCKLLVA